MLSTNPPNFWQIANTSFQHPSNLSDNDDNPTPDNQYADVFNNAFASVFTYDSSNNLPLSDALNYPSMPVITVTTSGIVNITDGLSSSSAVSSSAGLDNINSKVVKSTKHICLVFVSTFFRSHCRPALYHRTDEWGRLFQSSRKVTGHPL